MSIMRGMAKTGGVRQGGFLGFFVFLMLFLIVWLVSIPPAWAAADKEAVIDGNNAFALDLYKQIGESAKGGNMFFSPASISGSLAMTYAGARGKTASQMARTLHFTLAPERLHPAVAGVLAGLHGGAGAELAIANALWGQSGVTFRREFLDIVKSCYHGGFREIDFVGQPDKSRRTINRWIEEKTKERIKGLLQPRDIGDRTRLILTNAVYFKGSWLNKFESTLTVPRPFHLGGGRIVRTPMMKQQGRFGFFEDSTMQVLDMSYVGENLSMMILLPREGRGLEAVEALLTPQNFRTWQAGLIEERVRVELPRFRTSHYVNLHDVLVALGMKEAFQETADFSGMAENEKLCIAKVLHKAFVEVNEEGTEAAAATAVTSKLEMARQSPLFDFNADRPFIYMIRDRQSGSIIFIGRLTDPEPEG